MTTTGRPKDFVVVSIEHDGVTSRCVLSAKLLDRTVFPNLPIEYAVRHMLIDLGVIEP